MTNFKLFLTYKEKHQIIKSDYLIPIQTGRAISDEIFEEMIGDDTGNNISKENNKYNELSAQYWVWKNYDKIGNPDYVGFMHYRRHFIFDNSLLKGTENTWMKNSFVFRKENIDDNYIQTNFDKKTIESHLKAHDLIVLKPYDVKNLERKNIREQIAFLPQQQAETFDIMLASVTKLFPEYTIDVNELRTSSIQYLCNMFVMSKKLFFEYSNFCFTVLKDIDSQIDSSHFNILESRFLGFMGELLLTLFVKHYYRIASINIEELNSFFIENMPYHKEIEPIFSHNYTTIGMSCSNEYAPYLSVCLKSLVEHTSKNHNYDILIFEKSIKEKEKEILKKHISTPNISLRFVTISNQFENIKIPKCHYKEECSYRVLAPTLLQNYNKIIWTDCDLIFLDDIAKLDKVNCLTSIAACRDLIMNAHLGLKWVDWKNYLQNELNITHCYDYYNTGVILINIPQYISQDLHIKTMDLLKSKELRTLEQDALNSILQNNITYLDETWNVPTLQQQMKDWKFLEAMDERSRSLYKEIRKKPKIIHYAAFRKPWFYPDEDMADIWWQYARKTPFYEEILQKLIDFRISQRKPQANTAEIQQLRKEFAQVHFPNINNRFAANEYNTKLLFVIEHPMRFKLKKSWYAIKKAFAFGKRYQKYNQKYQSLKTLLKDAKKLKKSFFKI